MTEKRKAEKKMDKEKTFLTAAPILEEFYAACPGCGNETMFFDSDEKEWIDGTTCYRCGTQFTIQFDKAKMR